MFVIEFRSGSFFKDHAADHGTRDLALAKRFRNRRKARRFLDRHEWMKWNGGMVLRISRRKLLGSAIAMAGFRWGSSWA